MQRRKIRPENAFGEKYRKGHTAHQSCTAFVLSFLFIIMLQPLNHLIKSHGNNTEYNNRSNYHIQLEEACILNEYNEYANNVILIQIC